MRIFRAVSRARSAPYNALPRPCPCSGATLTSHFSHLTNQAGLPRGDGNWLQLAHRIAQACGSQMLLVVDVIAMVHEVGPMGVTVAKAVRSCAAAVGAIVDLEVKALPVEMRSGMRPLSGDDARESESSGVTRLSVTIVGDVGSLDRLQEALTTKLTTPGPPSKLASAAAASDFFGVPCAEVNLPQRV